MLDTPVLLTILKNDFIKAYRAAGYSTPIELEGGVDLGGRRIIKKKNPVTDEVLSIDFLAVDKHQKVSAGVPVVLVGESQVEKLNQGKVQLVKDTIEVEALPQNLPHSIEVDLSKIETANDVVFVRDLVVAKNVEIIDDLDQPVLTVVELSDEEGESTSTEEAAATA